MSSPATFTEMADAAELASCLNAEPAAVVLFTAPDCGVCTVLRPRLEVMLDDYPRVARLQVDCQRLAELARTWGVGALPTLVVVFEGRESVRFSRSFAVGQVAEALQRPYQLLFE